MPLARHLALALVLLAGLGGFGSGSGSGSQTSAAAPPGTSTSASTSTGAAAATGPCRTVTVPAPKGPGHLSAPRVRLDPHRTYTVTVRTNCGTFAFALDVRGAPRTAASMYYLVRQGFFDGLTFHRVAAGFVIQGGDPTGTGAGGPGYQIVEAPPRGTQYGLGTVAMAKTSTAPPGASGSQFFIVTSHSAGLPPDYALAGHVVSGMAVVERIGALPTNPPGDGTPSPAVVMTRVTVSGS